MIVTRNSDENYDKISKKTNLVHSVISLIIVICFMSFIGVLSFCNSKLALYPFNRFFQGSLTFRTMVDRIAKNYSSNKLLYKFFFVNLNGLFVRLCGKRVHNNVILLKNGTLEGTDYVNDIEINDAINNTIAFQRFLTKENIPFIQVLAPSKITLSLDNIPQGVKIDINQRGDVFVDRLIQAGVFILDLRPSLALSAEQVNKYFYRTDHHWNPDAAFVAYQIIIPEIAKLTSLNSSRYTDVNLWKRHELKDWFLGSRGKRVGVNFAGTDSLIYYTPLFETSMSCIIPYYDEQIYKGDFIEANIRKKFIKNKDYFGLNAYAVYFGRGYPLVQHRNVHGLNNKRLLLIKDSFMVPLQAFLTTEFTEIDVIDPRYYKVSTIAEYIKWTKPDVVLKMNYVGSITDKRHFEFGNVNKKMYLQNKEILKNYDVKVAVSESQQNKKLLPVKIMPGRTYTVCFDNVLIIRGKTNGISILVYDFKKKKMVRHAIFDVEYCKMKKKDSSWTFKVPDEKSKYGLLVYAGVTGKTKNIGVNYYGITVNEVVSQEIQGKN